MARWTTLISLSPLFGLWSFVSKVKILQGRWSEYYKFRVQKYYPQASWHQVFASMGFTFSKTWKLKIPHLERNTICCGNWFFAAPWHIWLEEIEHISTYRRGKRCGVWHFLTSSFGIILWNSYVITIFFKSPTAGVPSFSILVVFYLPFVG